MKVLDVFYEVNASSTGTNNPQASYGEALSKVNVAMTQLHKLMADHRKKFMQDPRNWGYVGDMQELEKKLQEMVNFFNHGNGTTQG